jgi:transcription antitermination factor NusG
MPREASRMSEYWYALHVRTRFERQIQTHLEDKGYEVFYPTYVSSRQWSDRVKSLSLPLFPGYVFCRFNVNARLPILITPGVNQVVGAGKTPIMVDESELAAIRRVIESGVAAQPWPYLKVGETVQVESGPLEGLTGIVTRIKNSNRLVVSVSLLMRSVAVELDRHRIKPVPASSRTAEGLFGKDQIVLNPSAI